jgi:acetyl-CoA C-acetyltransferase
MTTLANVCILGAAAVKVDRWHAKGVVTELQLLNRAVVETLTAGGVGRDEIGVLSFTVPGAGTTQRQFSPYAASRLGFTNVGRVSEIGIGGWTGGLAFDVAAQEIRTRRTRYGLALGVWFETGIDTAVAMDAAIRATGDVAYQSTSGTTPLSWYAMDADRWFHETRGTREELAEIALKNRRHAALNPLSQFRDGLTLSEILTARPVVGPLGVYDVSPRGDGAACLLLCDEETARVSGRPFSKVLSSAFSHDGAFQTSGKAGSTFPYQSLAKASKQALLDAGVALQDIDLFELYAPLTIVEASSFETIGLAEPGRGGTLAMNGESALGGRSPVNVSGGLLSRGHPTGVTALYDLLEIHLQLTDQAGARQVANAVHGFHACETGKFNGAMVSILERGRA